VNGVSGQRQDARAGDRVAATLEQSWAAYRRASATGEKLPEGRYVQLAALLRRERRLEDALAVSHAAVAAYPQSVVVLRQQARLCAAAGRDDEALDACRRVREIDPSDAEAAGAVAELLELRGEVEDAYRALRPVLGSEAVKPAIAQLFAKICQRRQPPSAEAVPLLEATLRNAPLTRDERIACLRALGHLQDALSHAREAFACFVQANRLAGFDRRQHEGLLAYMKWQRTLFSAPVLERLPRAGHGSELPLFIVGMPRSGTSLAEQILSSHPRVFGAGELTSIGGISLLRNAAGLSYEDWLARLDAPALDSLAAPYLAQLRGLAPDAARVTDKMPFNFLHLGLIELLFPQARVVHCVRNPLDTSLSCFFNGFADAYPFTRDLAALGTYYRGYHTLMRHWAATLALPMYTLVYEDLVGDPERVIRALLAFCGLEWEDACLRFHASRRKVSTPSYHQVRRPIYDRSVARHRPYDAFLTPLRRALGAELLEAGQPR
jgi:tetratricopeptide (TPR) repeat protein